MAADDPSHRQIIRPALAIALACAILDRQHRYYVQTDLDKEFWQKLALAQRSTIHRQPVVIVGASAAGLHAAYLLAKGGVPVYLFDERERLGPPARTLIVTSRMR